MDLLEARLIHFYKQDLESEQQSDSFYLFVRLSTSDSLKDLKELALLNEQRRLVWIIASDQLSALEEANVVWLKSPALELPSFESLPKGVFILQAETRDGKLSQIPLSFPGKTDSDTQIFPNISAEGKLDFDWTKYRNTQKVSLSVFFNKNQKNTYAIEDSFSLKEIKEFKDDPDSYFYLEILDMANSNYYASGPWRRSAFSF